MIYPQQITVVADEDQPIQTVIASAGALGGPVAKPFTDMGKALNYTLSLMRPEWTDYRAGGC
jgi:hypothetical protein